jgi:hypothetical protein
MVKRWSGKIFDDSTGDLIDSTIREKRIPLFLH